MEIKFQPKRISLNFEFFVLVFFTVVIVFYQCPYEIELFLNKGFKLIPERLTNVLFYPLFFASVNIIFLLILKKHLIVRGIITILSGITLSFIRFISAPGIIDPVYFFILSLACAAVTVVHKGGYLNEQFDSISQLDPIPDKAIDNLRDGYKYLIGKLFQGWLALGASLGVSMSILFKSDYSDPHLKFMAIKMLIGVIGVTIAFSYWIFLPLLNGIASLDELVIAKFKSNTKMRPEESLPK